MIQINKLYSLEDIKDIYYIDNNYNIINIKTDYIKKLTLGKRNYKYVTLECENGKNKKVYYHKIIALAFIENKPYTLINHKDGNTFNNNPENLEFSNHSHNGKHAYETGLVVRKEKRYKVILKDSNSHKGTIKELSLLMNIPRQTLYDNIYKGVREKNKYNIKDIIEIK